MCCCYYNDSFIQMLTKDDLLVCSLLSKKLFEVVSKIIVEKYYFGYAILYHYH